MQSLRAFSQPWGIDYSAVQCPVALFYGTDDAGAVPNIAMYELAAIEVPCCFVSIQALTSSSSHRHFLDVLPKSEMHLIEGGHLIFFNENVWTNVVDATRR